MYVGARLPHRGKSPTRSLRPARVPVRAVRPGQIRLGGRSSAAIGAILSKSDDTTCAQATRASHGFPLGVHSLWRRFSDDRDLLRLKIILLAGLVALAALLEWAV